MSDEKKPIANMLSKIVEAIRDDTRALGEAVMDSRGTRIFEKQIELAKVNLKHAKQAITDELDKELRSSRRVKFCQEKIDEQEQLIVDALNEKDESHAFQLATNMVDMERDRDTELAILKSHELHLGHLTRQMENAERSLKDLERQLAMVKTTEDIQKATEAISKSFDKADAKMMSAKRSLDRIRKKQSKKEEELEFNGILPEPSKHSLDLQKVLTDQSAEDVIHRIRNKE